MAAKPSPSVIKRQRLALVRNVRKFWDSLDSHLDYCIEKTPGEDRVFHVDTSIEYAEDMLAALKALR